MGESVSKFVSHYAPVSVTEVYNKISKKRKRNSSLEDEDESNLEETLHSPKKCKLNNTAQYIYKALFIDGRDYDVIVNALGQDWRLHKVYLTQSPYFQSMFSGSWKETDNKYIRIEIADPNISVESLQVVLGSLYLDDVSIAPTEVVGVLAGATLFQLDGLIDQCLNIMVQTTSPLTATQYYEAASQYGLQRIKHATVKWFLVNLMTHYPTHAKRLRQIEPDLMAVLVQDKDLVVVQTEFCLYWMLRFWVFLRLHPHWTHDEDGQTGAYSNEITDFFHNRPDSSTFLVSPEGKDYLRVFQGLHMGSLITQEQDLRQLKQDRILPEAWLYPALSDQWASLLRLHSGNDHGPESDKIAMDKFFSSCVRCGRVLESQESHTWKWKVFNFGLDLVWSTFNKMLTVRRASDDAPLSYNGHRNVMLRVTLVTLDKQRQIKLSQTSGVMSVMLVRNHEVKVMELCPEFEYPLIVSISLLSVTPQLSAPIAQ